MARAPMPSAARWIVIACVGCIALGIYLRVQDLAFPPVQAFDEFHFVENARNYLAGKPDWNDHPPLGKLLIAASIRAFGDTSLAWRLPSLCLGLALLGFAFALGRALFGSVLAGLIAAAFCAVDGMLIGYSRAALLDGMLACCALGTLLVLVRAPSPRALLAAGACVGLATSIKLSGVTLALPAALAVLWTRPQRAVALSLAMALCALGAYGGQYSLGLALAGQPAGLGDVIGQTVSMIEHHAALTQMVHPLTSPWYTWPLPTRPIPLRYDATAAGRLRVMIALGHPLLWWAGWAAVVANLGRLLWSGPSALSDGTPPGRPPATWLLCAAWVGFLSPWVLTSRDSYLYHYVPCDAIALVLVAGIAARAAGQRPRAVLSGVLAVAAVAVFYAPIWAQLPISPGGLGARLFLPIWRW